MRRDQPPNPWVARYQEALKADTIRKRAERLAQPAVGLLNLTVEGAARKLERALGEVYLVTEQGESWLRSQIEAAEFHAQETYTDSTVVLQAAYRSMETPRPYMPDLLTGLAGTGKSELVKALGRVFGPPGDIQVDSAHPRIPLIGYAECQMGHLSRTAGVLRQLVMRFGMDTGGGKRLTPADCAFRARAVGVCLLGVDETQFQAQSAGAAAMTTATLLSLQGLGVPWHVVANFSLVRKLLGRNQEATQRLIGRCFVLVPDLPGSPDWIRLLGQYKVVLKEAISFDPVEHEAKLWNLCAGLKRELCKLLVLSYRVARSAGSKRAGWSEVENAYRSSSFHCSRTDIEQLISRAAQSGTLRPDLECPLTGPETVQSGLAYREKLLDAHQQRMNESILQSAATPQERSALASASAALRGDGKVEQPAKKRRRTAPTLQDLQTSGDKLSNSVRRGR